MCGSRSVLRRVRGSGRRFTLALDDCSGTLELIGHDRGVSSASALDDTDVVGVNFKTYDRSKLMNALARGHPNAAGVKNYSRSNLRTSLGAGI
ncbi:hypothetical protein CC86DRAFT_407561 [Ophiobolus disseminans]|uniref:Splicing factor RBM39 linker domain-containing protein n=1 Tax=Ophiobolus disseminans TaxID=1469910 RepID=A0A6A6ZXB8_9PLEO|nr:hypothetical protein CC86DRAFT_407561 [Ophiobolus disseminans]